MGIIGLGGVLEMDFGFMEFWSTGLEMEYFWMLFLMEFWGSWKIVVLDRNDNKKSVFSTVDFNGRFKGRIHVILRLLIFTCCFRVLKCNVSGSWT